MFEIQEDYNYNEILADMVFDQEQAAFERDFGISDTVTVSPKQEEAYFTTEDVSEIEREIRRVEEEKRAKNQKIANEILEQIQHIGLL